MDSQEKDKIKYTVLDFQDFNAEEILRNGVNPNNQIKGVEIELNDQNRTRNFIKELAFRDVKKLNNLYDIHGTISRLMQILTKTDIYDEVNISLLPGSQEDKLKFVLDVKEKSRNYGHITQEVDRDGGLMVTTQFAHRNLFGLFDKISFESSKAFYASNRHTTTLHYSLPIIYRLLALDYSYTMSHKQLTKDVEIGIDGSTLKISNYERDTYVQFESLTRTNNLNMLNCSKYLIDHEFCPTHKRSIKVGRVFRNTRVNIIKDYGDYLEGNCEVSYPFSESKFVKVDFVYNKFFNPEWLENLKKFKYTNFENTFRFGFIKPLGMQSNYLNDRFIAMNTRGFSEIGNRPYPYSNINHPMAGKPGYEYLADYVGEDVILENTFKINFYKYPFLGEYNIVPFIYSTLYYLPGDIFRRKQQDELQNRFNLKQSLKENLRGVFGVGLGINLGAAKLELLFNHFHLEKIWDKKARLQLRLSIND